MSTGNHNSGASVSQPSSRLAKNSVWTFISKSIIFLARFMTGVLVARALGPEAKGLIHLMITAITTCMLLGNFGIGPAGIYFIGKDRKCLPSIVGNALALTGVIGVLIVSIAWLFLQYGPAGIVAKLPPSM